MSVYVSGSLAFDRIMTFKGNFKDHLLPDKLHILNVSFMVDSMDERKGGCAGNIAWSLALLNEKPIIVSSVGKDFGDYARALEKVGLPLDGITQYPDIFTALCYITTDLGSNQITGFYPGAMSLPATYNFPNLNADKDFAIISPGNVEDMRRLPEFFKKNKVPYIFDPGQQLPVIADEDLRKSIEGSFAVISNDYELNMICRRTGLNEEAILGRTLWLVTTLGEEGAHVRGADGTDLFIPAVKVPKVADPTGAGDAHRAGVLKGLINGLSVPEAAKLGAVAASFAIEHMGTQEHKYSIRDFNERYEASYSAKSPI